MVKISSKEKLKRIRTTQGWRAAYTASGLTDTGSDSTKRKRLSRAINERTSGYKPLTQQQRTRVSRSYGQRKKTIAKIQGELAIKKINQYRAAERATLRRLHQSGALTKDQLDRRLVTRQPLTAVQVQSIVDKAEDPDEWDDFRQEYAVHISTLDPTMMPVVLQQRLEWTQDRTAGDV
jgi:hypothetical protein